MEERVQEIHQKGMSDLEISRIDLPAQDIARATTHIPLLNERLEFAPEIDGVIGRVGQ